jgi:hypothetical protein
VGHPSPDLAQMVLLNASNLWKAASSGQKQRLQQVLFVRVSGIQTVIIEPM